MLCKSKCPFWSFKNNLGFTWRQDCVLFNLLDCVSEILLTEHVVKSDNDKFLHWSISMTFFLLSILRKMYISLCWEHLKGSWTYFVLRLHICKRELNLKGSGRHERLLLPDFVKFILLSMWAICCSFFPLSIERSV